MYFIFNRGLDSVLTTKGWILFKIIKKEIYDFIIIENKSSLEQITKNIINKHNKTLTKSTIIIRKENLLGSRPSRQALVAENKQALNSGASELVQLLCNSKAITINSTKLFPDHVFPEPVLEELKVEEDVEEEIVTNKPNNNESMYYIYNQGLDAVLTTKGWIEFSEIGDDSYLLLAFTNDDDIDEVKTNVLDKYTSTITRSTVILNEDMLLNKRLKPIVLGERDKLILNSCVQQLIQILIAKNGKKVNVSRIFSSTTNEIQVKTNAQALAQVLSQVKVEALELNTDEILRIKNEFHYETNDFVEESLMLLKKSEEIYRKSQEILSSYDEILNEVESQISDELHYIEFNRLDATSALEFSNNLHELRNKRRTLKDCLFTANLMVKQFDDEKIERLNHIQSKLEHLGDRSYIVRSPENFNH